MSAVSLLISHTTRGLSGPTPLSRISLFGWSGQHTRTPGLGCMQRRNLTHVCWQWVACCHGEWVRLQPAGEGLPWPHWCHPKHYKEILRWQKCTSIVFIDFNKNGQKLGSFLKWLVRSKKRQCWAGHQLASYYCRTTLLSLTRVTEVCTRTGTKKWYEGC